MAPQNLSSSSCKRCVRMSLPNDIVQSLSGIPDPLYIASEAVSRVKCLV